MTGTKWLDYYRAIDPELKLWQGRTDNNTDNNKERFFQFINCVDLNQHELPDIKPNSPSPFAIIGFACDTGVARNQGRVGAKAGPVYIRQALTNMAIHNTKSSKITEIYDLGDIHCDDDNLENAQAALAHLVAMAHDANLSPIILGGGHEIAYGHYSGLTQSGLYEPISIINFDAHFDLRPYTTGQGNSGTPFKQIADDCHQNGTKFDYTVLGIQEQANTNSLFETARILDTHYLTASKIHFNKTEYCNTLLDDSLNRAKHIYLTICLDVFSQAIAPGVSAPQANGLFPAQVLALIHHIMRSKKVISMDIAEYNPEYDKDNCTAKLAAQLITEYISLT